MDTKKLGRPTDQRLALVSGLASDLLWHGRIETTVAKAKAGQVEFRAEKAGVVHAGLGKMSFGEQKLEENIRAFIDAIQKAKPAAAKGTYIKAISLSSTQAVGLKIDLSDIK